MVMPEEGPLALGFGSVASEFVGGVLRDHGVDWIAGDGVERFDGEGRVQRVVTSSGRSIDADMVVMGTGAMPDVMLARSAGLELGETGGIACSAMLETSAPGIWAAGDACEYDSVVHGRRLRVEHWEVARAQGAFVAGALQGSREPYREVPYFWSDLADWCTLEYVGPCARWDHEAVRGSPADGEFTIYYLTGGRVGGALTVGRPEDLDRARELMLTGAEV